MLDTIEMWWILILIGWVVGVVMGIGAGWMARIVYLDWWWPRQIKKMQEKVDPKQSEEAQC